MKFTFGEKVKVKSGFYKDRTATVRKEFGVLSFKRYVCSSEYGVHDFFAGIFWPWQLEKA